jgi:hypothetical protein
MSLWFEVSNTRGDATINSPDELWLLALDYFQWHVDNPRYATQIIKYPLTYELVAVPKARAMSLNTFFMRAGLNPTRYANLKADEEYSHVCWMIETIIDDQLFGDAAAGLLSEGIITRKLGLNETVDHKSSDGSMAQRVVDPALADALAKKLTGE